MFPRIQGFLANIIDIAENRCYNHRNGRPAKSAAVAGPAKNERSDTLMTYGTVKPDLHIHTTVSDGTDTPAEILSRVREAGIGLFSVTDHDSYDGCLTIEKLLGPGDPAFVTGIEFSCRDEDGKYHILGYGIDPEAGSVLRLTEKGRNIRFEKLDARLGFLKERFGIKFPEKDLKTLYNLSRPGKPHIAALMVRYGYAKTKEEAMTEYIDKLSFRGGYVGPCEAIDGILEAGGIPVLAHPAYGSGEQLITGDDMEARIRRLIGYGLAGLEAFYSGFTPEIRDQTVSFAERFGLYATAGSDYHGSNKRVALGDTGLDGNKEPPRCLLRFIDDILGRCKK